MRLWAIQVAGVAVFTVLACSSPPDDATIDASASDAIAPATDAASVDAPVVDGATVVDAAVVDAAIDAPSIDAVVQDADTSEDATAGAGLAMLSDDFEGGFLDPSWQLFRDNIFAIDVSAGALHMTPNFSQLWFNMQQGAFVYKNASGNFKLTATVRARKESDPSMAAAGTVEMGGLMVRKDVAVGAGMQEDYVFIAVGSDGMQPVIETKSTNNGMSFFMGPAWPSTDAELRLCRIGADVYLYNREVGQTVWVEATTFNRPDMPGTVQLGAMICASTPTPDLRVSFEELVFGDATDQADCLMD